MNDERQNSLPTLFVDDVTEPEFYVTHPKDNGSEAYSLCRRSRLAAQAHHQEDSLALADLAIEKAKATHAQDMEVWALCLKSNALSTVGLYQEALDAASQATELSEHLGDKALQARGTFAIALVALDSGDERKAYDFLNQSLALAQKAQSMFDKFWALNNLSSIYGDRVEAMPPEASVEKRQKALSRLFNTARDALALADAMKAVVPKSFALLNLSNAYFLDHDDENAERTLVQCETLARAHGAIRILAYVTFDKVRLLTRDGHIADAIALIGRSKALENPAQGDDIRLTAQETLARLNHQIGNFEAAYAHLDMARQIEAKMMAFKSDRHLSVLTVDMEMRAARAKAERFALEAQALELRNKILEQEQVILRQNANEDALTGLGNRRAADAKLASLISDAKDMANGFQVTFMDVDYFKQVNDRFGHQVGDDVLTKLGEILRTETRVQDSVFRFGGEEFVLLLHDAPHDASIDTCNRLRKLIANHDWAQIAPGLEITASFGIAAWAGETEPAPIMARADKALYAAKENGRNRVEADRVVPQRR